MGDVSQFRTLLLEELELAVRTSRQLVLRIQPDQWDYRPKDNMRTLLELTHHLVMTPATDLAILQEKQGEEFDRIERDIQNVKDPAEMEKLMAESYELLKAHMLSLSESDFMNKSTKAFYAEHATLQVKWLIEIVTHAFHHRAQLFNYLKELGHDINMFNLY